MAQAVSERHTMSLEQGHCVMTVKATTDCSDIEGSTEECQGRKNVDHGYMSDSSTVGEIPRKRGRKRKEMCPDETEEMRVTANYQERQRMMKLNTALDQLRQCLPEQFKLGNRRVSKIRTLRLAANYIKSLGDILKQDTIIRESLPPQPGFEPRLPSPTEINRQGDSGEMYTPEKELSLIPSRESFAHTTHDYGYPVYASSSYPFPYNGHTTSSALSHLATFPQVAALQPYFPMYHPQFYPLGFQTLHHPSMGGAIMNQML